jgi:hypothetical protein
MRSPLLLYLSSADDLQRMAVAPALASAAERVGWGFECYYDGLRRGRHFGGGDPERAPTGHASGSLVAGGRHADQLLWLATAYELVVLGDPAGLLWPIVHAAGAESLTQSSDPSELYRAALERLGQPVPETVLVLDGAPQGSRGLIVAPYLYPAFFAAEPVLGIDVSLEDLGRSRLEKIGAKTFRGLYLESGRAAAFPGGLDSTEGDVGAATYATLTVELAERHRHWMRGVLLGDPWLVAAQLPRARRRRLLPLYGRPQVGVMESASAMIADATDPVYGRQYDDRDFFALARLGHSLQLVDPDPPFDAAGGVAYASKELSPGLPDTEPSDAQLAAWADERRILTTVLFWCGMLRELDTISRIIDLVATTGLAAGLIVTAESLENGLGFPLQLLSAPVDRGGVFGLLEPLLGSAGRGVAAEALLPPGTLAASLAEARAVAAGRLPAGLAPAGWWPLLDAPLVPASASRLAWRRGRPVVRFTPRDVATTSDQPARTLRSAAGAGARTLRLDAFLEEWRPFERERPGALDLAVAQAARQAGFSYMFSKTHFGKPAVVFREGDFVALSLTAGNWDGWSPFYTVGGVRDLRRAERRLLLARRPGWLVATIDSPLFALSGEVLERGATLYRVASEVAQGGRSGRLINVTPKVIARYARMLEAQGKLG